jgi:hypothetical protein
VPDPVFRAVAAERPGSTNRGGEVRVPGSRADTDAVLNELQEWQAARWIAHLSGSNMAVRW